MSNTERLHNNIESSHTILCTNCRNIKISLSYDALEASEEFNGLGWKATKYGNVYCPICASIKLKKEK